MSRSALTSLAAVDLNLLVAFDALMTEQSVTQAAARVGLTQPAMSHALERLRRLFDDPLFVRSPRGMLPTSRATELSSSVRRALDEVSNVLQPARTVQVSHRTVTLACADDVAAVLVPALYERLRAAAPGVDLVVRPLQLDTLERQLVDGDVDLGIGSLTAPRSRALLRQKLFQDRYVGCVRAGHAALDTRLTPSTFAALEHVAVSAVEPVDVVLGRYELQRRVVLQTALLTAPELLGRSNLVLTTTERIVLQLMKLYSLKMFAVPVEMDPLVVGQFWHERRARDAQHTALRSLLVEVCRDFGHARSA